MFDESPLDWMVEPSLGERLEPAGRHPDVFATIPAEPPNRVAQVMGTKYLLCEQTGFDTFSPIPLSFLFLFDLLAIVSSRRSW
jgi:hypothetical protein